MYKLLIVDDEAGHRAGLVGLLRMLKPDYLVFEAENGAVALRMMDVMEFDLVLTDIRMPQVDGLTFLEQAKTKSARTRIAILSAYGLFDYAKRGIILGADDYLLKPVDANELCQCLDRMENHLESTRTQALSGSNVESRMYLFITGELNTADQAATRALFGDYESGAVLHIQPAGKWQDAECRDAFQYGLRQWLKQSGNALVFRSPMERNAMIGIVACGKDKLQTLQSALIDRDAALRDEYGQSVIMGICLWPDDFFYHLEDAYTRARASCMQHFFEPGRTVFVSGAGQAPDPFSDMRLDVSIKGLDVGLCGGNVEQVCTLMEERLLSLCVPGAYPSKIKEVIMYTFIFLLGNLTYPLSQKEKDDILLRTGRTVLECGCMSDMLAEVRITFHLIASAIEGSRKNQREEVFEKVLHYLGTHYDQDLSLTDVAERFHYHPSYFSMLFKQSVGSTFSDYLSDVRMREAARLLKESSLYAAKIGQRVGYPNAAYFTKAFKKQFGMSPDQYRKRGR